MVEVKKVEILGRTSLFKNISRENLSALADICLSKVFQKKEMLFVEGDEGHSVYVLINGSIQLYKVSPEGREIVIKVVKPGEMFAEAVLFEQSRYPVNAVTLATSHVYMLPKHQFSCLLENKDFRQDFLGMMMKKVRYLTNQINYLSSYDVEERFFLFLEEQFGRKTEIDLNFSKKDIAAAIGTKPETLSRLLLRFKTEEKLVWEGKTVSIPQETWNKLDLHR